jgi:hypothetical protein
MGDKICVLLVGYIPQIEGSNQIVRLFEKRACWVPPTLTTDKSPHARVEVLRKLGLCLYPAMSGASNGNFAIGGLVS